MNERSPDGRGIGEREVWQIGGLQLDVGQQRVRKGGEDITLPKLSFDLLLTLARRSPDVVSYDELMDRVWPGLVVSPETIVQRVRLLRAAIGDEASEPRYIEALRSRGYRLVATANRVASVPSAAATTVESIPTPPELQSTPSTSPAPSPVSETPTGTGAPPPARWPLPLVALGGALLVLLLAVMLLRDRGAAVTGNDNATDEPVVRRPAEDPSLADSRERAARTVAVLPFENLSADPADAFIALAVPESTLDRLASLRNLTVIARDSALAAGRGAAGARELGGKLGAAWLVQGSTQRQGARVVVTARLVDARTEAQVWSGRFERPLDELFRLQDEIASGVTDVLAARLAGLQPGTSGTDYSADVEANLAFLRGRALLSRYTVAEAEAAALLFERAVAADPRFAAAQAALYDARMQGAALRREDLDVARRRYSPLILQAFASDARSGAAYLARARWSAGSSVEREADFVRGLELEPSNAHGMLAYVELLDGARRRDEAGRWLDRALVIDPLSPRGLFRRAMRKFDDAGAGVEREMLAVLERDPTFYPALQRYAKYRWQLSGEIAQAIEIIERAIASDPDNPWGRHTAVAFYLDVEQPETARLLAEGTPVSAASSATLRAQYAGKPDLAARSAMNDNAWAFGTVESWGVSEALRDAALRSGRGSPEERRLVARFAQDSRGGNRISVFNYRGRLLLAHLKLARGERTEGERELRELIAWMNINERFGLHHRPRALALMLLGDTDRALEELAASVEQDRDYRHWWYFFDREPIWAPVRSDPRFRAVLDRVRVHVERQRASLEALRASGQVPRRG